MEALLVIDMQKDFMENCVVALQVEDMQRVKEDLQQQGATFIGFAVKPRRLRLGYKAQMPKASALLDRAASV